MLAYEEEPCRLIEVILQVMLLFFLLGALCSNFSPVMLVHVCFKCFIEFMISYSSSLLMHVVVITNKC